MKIKVETVEVRHTKAHDDWRHSGLHSRAGFTAGRIIEVALDGQLYVGIVYSFSAATLETFAKDSGLKED